MNGRSGAVLLSVAVIALASVALAGTVSGWFDVSEELDSSVSSGTLDADMVLEDGEIKTAGGKMVLAPGFYQKFTVRMTDNSDIEDKYLLKLRFSATGPMKDNLDLIVVDDELPTVFEDGIGFNFVFTKEQMPHEFRITLMAAVTSPDDVGMTVQAISLQGNMPEDEIGRL